MKSGCRLTLGTLLMVFAVVACGGTKPLADRDPAGAEACESLAFSLKRSNTTVVMGSLLEAGSKASLADTPAIEQSATQLTGDHWIANAKKLRDACVAEGVRMPPLKSSD